MLQSSIKRNNKGSLFVMCTNHDKIHYKMNNPSSREAADFSRKQEGGGGSNITDSTRARAASSSISSAATPWLKSKDPRIVRVSRAFGGKDRHSKVCTVRGLRDRRVRLSVPTAIQLYDLQDRLGLNQPSKVVDWLLNASKHEIDQLPPLQFPPPGNFIQNHQHSFQSNINNRLDGGGGGGGYKINSGGNIIDWEDQTTTTSSGLPRLNNFWNSSTTDLSRSKSNKVFERETTVVNNEKAENWIKRNEEEEEKQQEEEEGGGGIDNAQVILPSNFFPTSRINNNNNHSSSLQGLLNSVMPYGSAYYHLEPPSNFTFSQLGGSHGISCTTSQQQQQTAADQDDVQNFNVLPLQQPTLSLPYYSGSTTTTHVLVCPQSGTTQAYFPSSSHIPAATSMMMEFDHPRQFNNHFHMLSSTSGSQNLLSSTSTTTLPSSFSSTTSQSMRRSGPFQLSMTPPNNHIVVSSQNDDSPKSAK